MNLSDGSFAPVLFSVSSCTLPYASHLSTRILFSYGVICTVHCVVARGFVADFDF